MDFTNITPINGKGAVQDKNIKKLDKNGYSRVALELKVSLIDVVKYKDYCTCQNFTFNAAKEKVKRHSDVLYNKKIRTNQSLCDVNEKLFNSNECNETMSRKKGFIRRNVPKIESDESDVNDSKKCTNKPKKKRTYNRIKSLESSDFSSKESLADFAPIKLECETSYSKKLSSKKSTTKNLRQNPEFKIGRNQGKKRKTCKNTNQPTRKNNLKQIRDEVEEISYIPKTSKHDLLKYVDIKPVIEIMPNRNSSDNRCTRSSQKLKLSSPSSSSQDLFSDIDSIGSYKTEMIDNYLKTKCCDDSPTLKEKNCFISGVEDTTSKYLYNPFSEDKNVNVYKKLIEEHNISTDVHVTLNRPEEDTCKRYSLFQHSEDEGHKYKNPPQSTALKLKRSYTNRYGFLYSKIPKFRVTDVITKLTSKHPLFANATLTSGFIDTTSPCQTSKTAQLVTNSIVSAHKHENPTHVSTKVNCSINLGCLTDKRNLSAIVPPGSKDTLVLKNELNDSFSDSKLSISEISSLDSSVLSNTSDSNISLESNCNNVANRQSECTLQNIQLCNSVAEETMEKDDKSSVGSTRMSSVKKRSLPLRESSWKNLSNELLDKSLPATSTVKQSAKHVLTFPSTAPLMRPPTRKDNIQIVNKTEPCFSKSSSSTPEPIVTSISKTKFNESLSPLLINTNPLTQFNVNKINTSTPPETFKIANSSQKSPEKEFVFQKPQAFNLPFLKAQKLPSRSQKNHDPHDDVISIFADSIYSCEDHVEAPSQKDLIDPQIEALTEKSETFVENMADDISVMTDDNYVKKWLDNTCEPLGICKEKKEIVIQPNPNPLFFLCLNVKKTGSCKNKLICSSLHPDNLLQQCENLSETVLCQEYEQAKLNKYLHLYRILFDMLTKKYCEKIDLHKLADLVTDVIMFNDCLDKLSYIAKVLNQMCTISGLTPQSAIEIIFRKVNICKEKSDLLADMLLEIILNCYDITECYQIILALIKSKDFNVTPKMTQKLIETVIKPKRPNKQFVLKVYRDIIIHIPPENFSALVPKSCSLYKVKGFRDIAEHLIQKLNVTSSVQFSLADLVYRSPLNSSNSSSSVGSSPHHISGRDRLNFSNNYFENSATTPEKIYGKSSPISLNVPSFEKNCNNEKQPGKPTKRNSSLAGWQRMSDSPSDDEVDSIPKRQYEQTVLEKQYQDTSTRKHPVESEVKDNCDVDLRQSSTTWSKENTSFSNNKKQSMWLRMADEPSIITCPSNDDPPSTSSWHRTEPSNYKPAVPTLGMPGPVTQPEDLLFLNSLREHRFTVPPPDMKFTEPSPNISKDMRLTEQSPPLPNIHRPFMNDSFKQPLSNKPIGSRSFTNNPCVIPQTVTRPFSNNTAVGGPIFQRPFNDPFVNHPLQGTFKSNVPFNNDLFVNNKSSKDVMPVKPNVSVPPIHYPYRDNSAVNVQNSRLLAEDSNVSQMISKDVCRNLNKASVNVLSQPIQQTKNEKNPSDTFELTNFGIPQYSKQAMPFFQQPNTSLFVNDQENFRIFIDQERMHDFICLVKKYLDNNKIDECLQICVDIVQKTKKHWPTFYSKLYQHFKVDGCSENKYRLFLKTFGINIILCLVSEENWQQANSLLKLLYKHPNLPDVKSYTSEEFSQNKIVLALFQVFIMCDDHRAWEFACKQQLCRNRNDWIIELNDEELLYRNKLFDKWFELLCTKRNKIALTIAKYLMERNCNDIVYFIDFRKFLNNLLVMAVNEKFTVDFFIMAMWKFPKWNEMVSHTTFRALIVVLVKDDKHYGLFSDLYKIACETHIYTFHDGTEYTFTASFDLLEEELFFCFFSFLKLKSRFLPITRPLTIRFEKNTKLRMNSNSNVPHIFLRNHIGLELSMGRMKNILRNRIAPPLLDIPCSANELTVTPASLTHHFNERFRIYGVPYF